MHEVTEEMKAASEYFISPRSDYGLVIFGRAWTKDEVESYGDDWSAMDYKQNGGYIFGEWSSTGCVEGELGSNHATRCIQITREVYEKAQTFGWDYHVIMVVI